MLTQIIDLKDPTINHNLQTLVVGSGLVSILHTIKTVYDVPYKESDDDVNICCYAYLG